MPTAPSRRLAPVAAAALAVAALAAAALAAACGEPAPPPVDGNPGGQTYTLTWGPVEVAPGTEDTRCVTLRLGNDIPVKIDRIENDLGLGSHHFIVYRVGSGEEQPQPTPCAPFLDVLDPTVGAPLMVTQRAEEVLQLPEGVAFTLQPDQLIRLEVHFVNAGTAPITVTATSTFHAMADADFRAEADFLFIGNPDIQLAPREGLQTLGPTWFPMPATLSDLDVFAITGHTHALGVDVEVAAAAGPDDPGVSVYDPVGFDWSEPETVRLDPPLRVTEGGGFRFSCAWNNTTGRTVYFGESARDEMCFFWAYYYPSQGAKVCVHTEMYTDNPLDICCPDDVVYCAILAEYLGNLAGG